LAAGKSLEKPNYYKRKTPILATPESAGKGEGEGGRAFIFFGGRRNRMQLDPVALVGEKDEC